MRTKYIEERWPELMELGGSPDGKIGVCTTDDRVDLLLDKSQAEPLMVEWNKMQNFLTQMAQAFDEAAPEAFKEFWYGKTPVQSIAKE
jgi:hypothetical protein